MFRKHGEVQPVRHLIDSTQCGACLREYFTHGKIKMHLLRSATCRAYLLAHGGRHIPAPGLGSEVDKQQLAQHDGKLPPLQAAGPTYPRPPARDISNIHWEMHDQIAETALQLERAGDFENAARAVIKSTVISWTRCQETLQEFLVTLETETEPLGLVSIAQAQRCLRALCQPEQWSFLMDKDFHSEVTKLSLEDLEDQFQSLQMPMLQCAPRVLGRHRILLHAFSGRRRPGDVQYFLEQMQKEAGDGTILHVVSLDLMTDPVWGDATKASTQRFWRDAADRGHIHAFLAGPPCETWSQARHAQTNAPTEPRPIRSSDMLWGFEALSLRELEQILIGNDLLHFSFDMMLRLYFTQGCGIIEHPDMPADEQKPSIWRLPILALFRALSGFEEVSFGQGLLGAASPKPTRLLALNLPTLKANLRAHHITKDPPKSSSIGKMADGTWCTGYLKEYPPSMCRALGAEFKTWLQRQETDWALTIDHAFLAKCRRMNVQEFTDFIGQDFAAK